MKKIVSILLILLYSSPIAYSDTVAIHGFDFKPPFNKGIYQEKVVEKAIPQHGKKNNQIVIGHSQGGLTAIAYARRDDVINKVKAVITVNAPVKGFEGFRDGYSAFRNKVLYDIKIHNRALSSAANYAILPGVLSVKTENIMKELVKNTDFSEIVDMALENERFTKDMQEIIDMNPKSDFMAEHIVDGEYVTYGEIIGWTKKQVGRSEWIDFPILKPYVVYKEYKNPYKKIENKLGHIVGTDNDPLNMMDEKTRNDIKVLMSYIRISYATAEAFLKQKYMLTPWWWGEADNCKDGKKWIDNYVKEWGDVLGGKNNDGFIAVNSQTLTNNKIEYKTDHVSAMPPGLVNGKFEHTENVKTNKIYSHDSGLIKNLLKEKFQIYDY